MKWRDKIALVFLPTFSFNIFSSLSRHFNRFCVYAVFIQHHHSTQITKTTEMGENAFEIYYYIYFVWLIWVNIFNSTNYLLNNSDPFLLKDRRPTVYENCFYDEHVILLNYIGTVFHTYICVWEIYCLFSIC